MKREAAVVGERIERAAATEALDSLVILALVEKEPSLLTVTQVHTEPYTPFPHGDRLGHLAGEHVNPFVESFEATDLGIVSREDAARPDQRGEELDNELDPAIHALAERLDHEIDRLIVTVAIDNEGRQPIALPVDKPARGAVDRQSHPVLDGGAQPEFEQITLGDRRACRIRGFDFGMRPEEVEPHHHSKGDLRQAAPKREAEYAAAIFANADEVAGLGHRVDDVRLVHPRMPRPHAIGAAVGDDDGWQTHTLDILRKDPAEAAEGVWYHARMRIALGADHAGVALKEHLKQLLDERGMSYRDFGTHSTESVDYPDYAALVGREVAAGGCDRGILCCGSGLGMAIAANKIAGVRAVSIVDEDSARLSREHNDANVLALGGRLMAFDAARRIVNLFLDTPFAGGRHERRIEKITQLDRLGR